MFEAVVRKPFFPFFPVKRKIRCEAENVRLGDFPPPKGVCGRKEEEEEEEEEELPERGEIALLHPLSEALFWGEKNKKFFLLYILWRIFLCPLGKRVIFCERVP